MPQEQDNRQVELNLDKAPVAAFEDRLNKAIQDGSINQAGWKLSVNDYDISVPGRDTHRSIILEGPNGFYASIDTNTYDGRETGVLAQMMHKIFPYATGTEMRMTSDLDKQNWVVVPENLVRSTTLFEGTGSDAMLQYLRIAEQAKEFNTSGADYSLYAEDTATKQRANSNAGPTQILENLGYDVRHAGANKDVDLRAREYTVNGAKYTAPGAEHEIKSLFPIDRKGFFEGYTGNPAELFRNQMAKNEAMQLMRGLHPDVIALSPDNQTAPTLASNPETLAAKQFEHFKQEAGQYTVDPDVMKAQDLMNRLKALTKDSGIDLGGFGNQKNGVDGRFGEMTFKSVIASQKILGMEPDGGITNTFVEKLEEKIEQLSLTAGTVAAKAPEVTNAPGPA